VGINDSGAVVGYSEDPATCADYLQRHATLWKDGQVRDLNDLIPSGLGIRLIDASKINASGVLLARGFRLDEPMKTCGGIFDDPAIPPAGQIYKNFPCQPIHSYVLTPNAVTTYAIVPSSVTRQESDGSASLTVTRSPATSAETVYVSTVQTHGFTNENDYVGLENVALGQRACFNFGRSHPWFQNGQRAG